ncbi:sodium-dependent bicarbonate transport family permease [Pelagicoccus mobilis]|uniref:Sodium-dependent bicarbonate transport family permease n=1 Tax=Pelagicoccus mobilis TaxID=415221 RepID=A0A934RWU6_9BACT|nr:sodium-dependent bicarbonate transport family permease [Pelagicoccus mobilis]MBK1879205.1 sodium-dependent bicarbonate transport family permease [Pelagicoccus mobilis]
MESAALYANLFSPPVLAFGAGVIAVFARSDLKIPEQVYQGLAIYLLLAIGFKGGASLAETKFATVAPVAIAAILLGSLLSAAAFYISKYLIFKSVSNAAAIAAHYGSVSAVTFMTCLAFLESRNVPFESFLPAVMALMEIPAIVIAIMLAKLHGGTSSGNLSPALREAFTGKSVYLLVAGLVIGAAAGPLGAEKAAPFLIQPFYGVLIIFLLEMGLVAGKSLKSFTDLKGKLIAFAIIAPLVQGIIGVYIAKYLGLSAGGATLFATLAASASYIAAPAAARIALPDANPAYYVFTSLGITFPLNLALGIPIYHMAAKQIIGG